MLTVTRSVCCVSLFLKYNIHFKYIRAGKRDLIPDTYICSASAQKAELKVVGVLDVGTLGGAGISMLVCTRRAEFEMDWWNFGVFQ